MTDTTDLTDQLDEASAADLQEWLDTTAAGDGVLDLFAGPGGWDEGIRQRHPDLHPRTLGVEWDDAAVATRRIAGHHTLQGDVALLPTSPFAGHVEGLIASPPCQAYSQAGRGKGRDAVDELLEHVHGCRDGWAAPPDTICDEDTRADLTLQPLRWVWDLRPRWVICEQVPPVGTLWEAMTYTLRAWGYEAATITVNAANYGVPQTRRRAILMARRDGERVTWPEATHHDPRKGLSLFGEPWVSMAEALGWTPGGRTIRTGANTMKHSRDAGDMVPYERPVEEPAPTVTGGGVGAWKVAEPDEHVDPPMRWKVPPEEAGPPGGSFQRNHGDVQEDVPVLVNGNQANAARRRIDEPAPTMLFGHALNDVRWIVNTGRDWKPGGDRSDAQTIDATEQPAPTVDGKGRWHVDLEDADGEPVEPPWVQQRNDQTDHDETPHDWPLDRPATTIASRDLVPDPGANANRHNGATKSRNDGIRVSVEQAGVLQTFPEDYPWQGTKTKRFEQVGNAVPPLLAAVLIDTIR